MKLKIPVVEVDFKLRGKPINLIMITNMKHIEIEAMLVNWGERYGAKCKTQEQIQDSIKRYVEDKKTIHKIKFINKEEIK